MQLDLSALNWGAVAVSVIAGQIISTLWFTALFGKPWAQEYGASSPQEHTLDIPKYTYGVQLLCTIVLVISLALLQQALSVQTASAALQVGAFVAIGFCIATGLPGQAFLRRWRVAAIALGSQVAMILGISLIFGLWQ